MPYKRNRKEETHQLDRRFYNGPHIPFGQCTLLSENEMLWLLYI